MPFGSLGRASGLRGGIRLFLVTGAEASVFEALDEVYVEGLGVAAVEDIRRQGRRWIVYLAGVHRREQAEQLVHAQLFVPASVLPAAASRPLPGASVRLANDPIGSVIEVRSGAQDLVLVRIGEDEVLLPLAAPYLHWDGRVLTLDDPPEGLLP